MQVFCTQSFKLTLSIKYFAHIQNIVFSSLLFFLMFITNPYCDETVTYAEKLLSFLGSSLVSS